MYVCMYVCMCMCVCVCVQAKENGYLMRGPPRSSDGVNKYEVYYEPHCMYDERELAQYKADVCMYCT